MPDNVLHEAPRGLVIAAPSSGAGKTTLTLGLLRALKRAGTRVVSAKSGPDYIDPKFHEAASGAPCINLDAWAMYPGTVRALAAAQTSEQDLLILEGAMGLFDGAANGRGAVADLAALLNLPVVLVVDCAKQAQSVAALVHGFSSYRKDIALKGVVLNRVGSHRHEKMLRTALEPVGVTVLGALPRASELVLPERHLGLVQAGEHRDLETFLQQAADLCERHIDLVSLQGLASGLDTSSEPPVHLPSPLGQRIAVARDLAFAFSYPHLLNHWYAQGAELSFFSPLANERPDPDANAVYLPGGYPELHADRLSNAETFRTAMKQAAGSGTLIYGECGGYMTLGTGLTDAEGHRHEMLGLLPLETSFQARKRHLGYRMVQPLGGLPWNEPLSAHEFHYASIVSEGQADRLFDAKDAEDNQLAEMGLRRGAVLGSFAHVISCAA